MDRAAFERLITKPGLFVTMTAEVMHRGGAKKDTVRRPVGVEMLMRVAWPSEDDARLVMRPDLLIQTARDLDPTGLLCARVQAMAIERASEAAERIIAKHPDVMISMNVCGNDLLANVELRQTVQRAVSRIRGAGRQSGTRSDLRSDYPKRARAVIELSEHHLGVADRDVDAVVNVTQWLRRTGARVWFDDLGDGEASLATLDRIQDAGGFVDGIKLSREQTLRFLAGDEGAVSLFGEASRFCAKYEVTLTIEGVEKPKEMADSLRAANVDPDACLVQGHGWGAYVTLPSRAHETSPDSLRVPLASRGPALARISTATTFSIN